MSDTCITDFYTGKRRKVRCSLATENDTICSNCQSRNIPCVLQDANSSITDDEGHTTSPVSSGFWKGASDRSTARASEVLAKPTGDAVVSERLSQIEHVLSQIASREGAVNSPSTHSPSSVIKAPSTETPEQLGRNQAGPAALVERPAPVFALFQNTFFGKPITSAEDGPDGPANGLSQRLEQFRSDLASLLPSQEDADLLAICTDSWASSQIFGNLDRGFSWQENLAPSLNLEMITNSQPLVIAKTLLYIVLWIQQLPKQFDPNQLPLRGPPEPYIKECITKISRILSEDELACSKDGLECLILLGTLHANVGNIRKAWLIFRRALSIVNLNGMPQPKDLRRESPDTLAANGGTAANRLWEIIVENDCRLSLLLVLPSANPNDAILPEGSGFGGYTNPQATLQRHICAIAYAIGRRTFLDGFSSVAPSQIIDENIDKVQRELPDSWWSIPELSKGLRTQETAREYHRLVLQMWFYQLKILLHLPFSFRAFKDKRFNYNRITCMASCEELLRRYIELRRPDNAQIYCAPLDFLAFIASTTIILSILQKLQAENGDLRTARDADMALVQQALDGMELFAANNPRDRMTRRGAQVLRTLLSVHSDAELSNSTTNLDVPFFGKVSITRPQGTPSNEPSPSSSFVPDTPTSRHSRPVLAGIIPREPRYGMTTAPSPTATWGYPTISFDINSFMPSCALNSDWNLGVDNVFFDGLSDLGPGPWIH